MAAVSMTPAARRLQQLCAYLSLWAADDPPPVAPIAQRVLQDMVVSVESLATRARAPRLTGVLSACVPVDSAKAGEPAVVPELMPPTNPILLEATWAALRTAFNPSPQSTPIVLVTGVSGAGKTKAAMDIGRLHAFVVVAHISTHGMSIAPWRAFQSFMSTLLTPGLRDGDLPPMHDRVSLLAAMTVLVGASLEYALDVTDAVLSAACSDDLAAAIEMEAAHAPVGARPERAREAVLRQAVLRAQRDLLASARVARLFSLRMRELLAADGVIGADASVHLPRTAAQAYMMALRDRALAVWGHRDADTGELVMPPVVFAYDDAHQLLPTMAQPQRDVFFGTHDADADAGAAAAAARPAALTDGATRARERFGLFYGLLATIHSLTRFFPAGHLLLGSSCDMASEALASHSPVQGKTAVIDEAITFTEADVTLYLQRYLTPAAMEGVESVLVQQLQGRPLVCSAFWRTLLATCDETTAPPSPAEAVRRALQLAYTTAEAAAGKRIDGAWDDHTRLPFEPMVNQLLARLAHAIIMEATIADGEWDSFRPQLHVAVQRGILNAPMVAGARIDLRSEPATQAALLQAGLARVRAGTDGITQLLASRLTGPAGRVVDDRGPLLEDCIMWMLVHPCIRHGGSMSLGDLLRPFLARSDSTVMDPSAASTVHPALLPTVCDSLHVQLTRGCRVDGPGRPSRCPLSLLASDPSALVHRAGHGSGGADWWLPARDSEGRIAPVLFRCSTRENDAFHELLDSLNMGWLYAEGASVDSRKAAVRASRAAGGIAALTERIEKLEEDNAKMRKKEAALRLRGVGSAVHEMVIMHHAKVSQAELKAARCFKPQHVAVLQRLPKRLAADAILTAGAEDEVDAAVVEPHAKAALQAGLGRVNAARVASRATASAKRGKDVEAAVATLIEELRAEEEDVDTRAAAVCKLMAVDLAALAAEFEALVEPLSVSAVAATEKLVIGEGNETAHPSHGVLREGDLRSDVGLVFADDPDKARRATALVDVFERLSALLSGAGAVDGAAASGAGTAAGGAAASHSIAGAASAHRDAHVPASSTGAGATSRE